MAQGLGSIELVSPLTLEVKSVQQVTHGILVELFLLDSFLDHAFGMVTTPLIDHVAGLTVTEVAALGRRVVILISRLSEGWQQLTIHPCVDIDVVGNGHTRLLVEGGGLVEEFAAEAVDDVGRTDITTSQDSVDFLTGDAIGAIVEHTQIDGDAQGRQYLAIIGTSLTEQAEGEVVV